MLGFTHTLPLSQRCYKPWKKQTREPWRDGFNIRPSTTHHVLLPSKWLTSLFLHNSGSNCKTTCGSSHRSIRLCPAQLCFLPREMDPPNQHQHPCGLKSWTHRESSATWYAGSPVAEIHSRSAFLIYKAVLPLFCPQQRFQNRMLPINLSQ